MMEKMETTDTATEESISVGERSPESMDEDQIDPMTQDPLESKNRSKRKPSKTQIKHIAPKDEEVGVNGNRPMNQNMPCTSSKYGANTMDDLFRDVTQGIYHVSEVQPDQQPVLTQRTANQGGEGNNVASKRPRRTSHAQNVPHVSSGRSPTRPAPCYPCGICGKIFRVPSRYDSHMLGHSKGKPFCCNTCGKMFASQEKLDQHLPVHNCDRAAAFTCESCGKVCVNWRAYLYHLKAQHSESGGKKFACNVSKSKLPGGKTCNLCGRHFHSGQRLRNHMASHEIGKNHCCHTCGKLFESQKKLDTHIMVHSLPSKHGQQLRCQDCGKEYSDWIPFKQHMKTHGAEGVQYPCGLCEMVFPTQYEKEKHKRVHKQLQCEFCERFFRSASVLSVHLRVHTGERPYKCGLCDRDFSQSAVLKVHMRTHRKEGRYECKRCGNVYLEVMEYFRHHLAHLEEGNLQCEECGKMFETINSKNRHMAAHRDRSGRVCQVCGKEFGRMSHLEAHMLCHTDQVSLLCKVCGKVFPSQELLSAHYATHLGGEGVSSSGLPASKGPLFCGLCGKMFKAQVYLNNHMKRHEREGLNACGGDEILDEEVVEVEGGEFSCQDCGKAYAKKHHLAVHRREHTGEKPHTCILCGISFMYRKALMDHIGEHKRNGLMMYSGKGQQSKIMIAPNKKKSSLKAAEMESGSETETDNEDHIDGPLENGQGYTNVKASSASQQTSTSSFKENSYSKHPGHFYAQKSTMNNSNSNNENSAPEKMQVASSSSASADTKIPSIPNEKLYTDTGSSISFDDRQFILDQERLISSHLRQYESGQDRQYVPSQDRQYIGNQDRHFSSSQDRQFVLNPDRQFISTHDRPFTDNHERQFPDTEERPFIERQYNPRKKAYVSSSSLEYVEKFVNSMSNGEPASNKGFVEAPNDVYSRKYVGSHDPKYDDGNNDLRKSAAHVVSESQALHYRSAYNPTLSLPTSLPLGTSSTSLLQSPLQPTDPFFRPDLEERLLGKDQTPLQMLRPQPQFPTSSHLEYRAEDMAAGSFAACGSKMYLGNLPARSAYHTGFPGHHGRFPTDSQLVANNFQLLPQTAFPENTPQS